MSEGSALRAEPETVSDVLTEAFGLVTQLAELDTKTRAKKRSLSISTGFQNIDQHTGGLWPGELTVVTGGPGVGKSSFAANLAVNAAKRGARVLLVALGANAIETVIRMCATEGLIETRRLFDGRLNQDDWGSLAEACNKLAKLDLFICDDARTTIEAIRSIALSVAEGSEKAFVVIDGIELAALPDGGHALDWPQAAGSASMQLKKLAREMNAPVLATMDYRTGRRFRRVDSYEDALGVLPGGAGSAADSVIHISRHLASGNADGLPSNTVVKVILAKHRLCEPAETELMFVPGCARFMDSVE